MNVAAFLALSYGLGAIPFGWIAVKLLRGIDLRTVGSGGIGATNACRVLGNRWFLPILTLDALKGVGAVLLGTHFLNRDWAICCGLAAALGHCFPLVLGGKGGKAVGTGLGMLLACQWQVGLLALSIWAAVYLVSQYVSLGSIVATLSLIGMEAFWQTQDSLTVRLLLSLTALLVLIMHRQNIQRLLSGTESKTYLFKKGAPSDAVVH